MADNENDQPQNQGAKGLLKRSFGEDSHVVAGARGARDILKDRHGPGPIVSKIFLFSSALFGASLIAGPEISVSSQYDAPTFEAENAGLDVSTAEFGYQAVTYGKDLYLLTEQNGTYRLFIQDGQNFELLESSAEAFPVIRKIGQAFEDMAEATVDIDAVLPDLLPIPQDIDGVSVLYDDGLDGEDLYRVSGNISEDGIEAREMQETYAALAEAWKQASLDLAQGAYGVTAEDILSERGTTEEIVEKKSLLTSLSSGMLFSSSLILVLGAGLGASSGISRNRAAKRRAKQNRNL